MAIQAESGNTLPNINVYARTNTAEGRWLNVTTFAYPVADKTIAQVIVHLFRDVTEQKSYRRFVDSVLSASERLQQNEACRDIPTTPADSQVGRLTARKRQVVALLVHGLGTAEIAGKLAISPSTVRNHVQNILDKLGVHSRLEAIAYAYQHCLIEIDES